MKKIYTYISIVIALCITSCNKFIDREPISNPTEANFFQEVKDFEGAIISIYDELQSSDQYSGRFLRLMEVRADNVEDQNSSAAGGVNYEIEAFNDTPSNGNFSASWLSLYQIVFRANLVLQNINKVPMTDTQRNNIEGQATFLRGLTYFNLVRLWGEVPLILQTQTVEEARNNKRASVANIYAQIIADLQKAKNLPTQWSDAEKGRATQYAAQALLTKVYLYQKEYALALNELTPLVAAINSGKIIGLVPSNETFPNSLKTIKDILFAVQYLKGGVGESVYQNNRYRNQDGGAVISLPQSLFEANDNRKALVAPTSNGNRPLKFNADRLGNETSGDFPIIRCAEVMLLYAEVANELATSPTQDALDALNAVRSNTGITQKTLSDFATKDDFRNEVYLQRRLELALECDRWFDIVRTGQFSTIYPNVDSYRQLYPIPAVEIENVNDKTNW
ncbi:RagB/SusD family nutrient uptake outer membrane protein [Capnocytophaga catalasegens]|uniref:Membrane protein n=1 Tax=Capnocytophaga catalasegens TaxID=1004260 RepID=A0AAV5AX56_9FLAO|nr:RagB/SusD family nutrient uptake outer membrane protein [Capnocytophaga catalasegens]GIZ16370.1 membrane protein [Capnocytophaga catalasegens]GJM49911.1 membrane protein [Capnocytophaga catalasegens]GJM54262.1 membrane protein [Capnocytophaga catalasegens]